VVEQRTAENALKTVGMEFVGNALSFNTITRQLSDVLSAAHGEKGRYWDGYVQEVFTDHVIFSDGKKSMRQNYSASDKGVSLVGNPVEVVRVVSYQPVATANAADDLIQKEQSQMFEREKHLTAIFAANTYTDAEKEAIKKFSDDQLKLIRCRRRRRSGTRPSPRRPRPPPRRRSPSPRSRSSPSWARTSWRSTTSARRRWKPSGPPW
jgi:hypothetical protein